MRTSVPAPSDACPPPRTTRPRFASRYWAALTPAAVTAYSRAARSDCRPSTSRRRLSAQVEAGTGAEVVEDERRELALNEPLPLRLVCALVADLRVADLAVRQLLRAAVPHAIAEALVPGEAVVDSAAQGCPRAPSVRCEGRAAGLAGERRDPALCALTRGVDVERDDVVQRSRERQPTPRSSWSPKRLWRSLRRAGRSRSTRAKRRYPAGERGGARAGAM